MTTQSVVAAAITLVNNHLPGTFVTVQDVDDREFEPLRPDDLPACLFAVAPAMQRRLAIGTREEQWRLEAHIWRFDNPIPGTASTFRALVEQLRTLFQQHPQFDRLADTASSQLGLSADGSTAIQTVYSQPIRRGATAERHALVSVAIRDWVQN